MAGFNKFFTAVLLAVTYAATVSAAPQPQYAKLATHRTRELHEDLVLETFNPESTYEVSNGFPSICQTHIPRRPLVRVLSTPTPSVPSSR